MADAGRDQDAANAGSCDPTIHYPARDVPVPDTVSAELRQRIIDGPPGLEPPYPATTAEWHHAFVDPAEQLELVSALLDQHRLTLTSCEIAGVRCFTIQPVEMPGTAKAPLLINIHGGGYVLDGGEGGTVEAILMAATARSPVLAVDYRLAPDFPFPAAIDDCMAVWAEVNANRNPRQLALFGTSTGGALILSMVQRAKLENLPIPAALSVGTPWSDLTKTGDSYYINSFGSQRYEGPLALMADHYAGELDKKDPRVSPIYGDFTGFPPTILTTGTRDVFLSNTVRVDRKLREAGVETRLQVLEGFWHALYLDHTLPESRWVFREIHDFLAGHLDG